MNALIVNLYKFYSQFVPKEVLDKMFRQGVTTRRTGYEEIRAEILSSPEENVIPEISKFIVSINRNFVSEQIKNTDRFILFIEYSAFNVIPNTEKGVLQKLGVSVAHPFSDKNNDNLNEVLLMDQSLDILYRIIHAMQEMQNDLDFCATQELIRFPLDIHVVDPVEFYGCGGWAAIFDNSTTIL